MEIYHFGEIGINKVEIVVTAIEIEKETAKYYFLESQCTRRLDKTSIGKLQGFHNYDVYLLENDIAKARDMFIEKHNCNIRRYQDEIQNEQRIIADLEKIVG